MSKDNIRVKGLADVRLRSDGEEIHLTFLTSHNKKLTVVISGSEMENLSLQMMTFDRQAAIKREVPRDQERPKLTIDAPPAMFFTHKLQGIVRPEKDALDLQIQDVTGHEIQVCFTPEQVKYLFDKLLELRNFDDNQLIH